MEQIRHEIVSKTASLQKKEKLRLSRKIRSLKHTKHTEEAEATEETVEVSVEPKEGEYDSIRFLKLTKKYIKKSNKKSAEDILKLILLPDSDTEESKEYHLSKALVDYEVQNLEEAKFCKILKLSLYKTPQKYLLGLYAIKKRLDNDSGVSIRAKILKSGVLQKINFELFERNQHPDFWLLALKMLTLFLQGEARALLSPKIDSIFRKSLIDFFGSQSSTEIVHAVNLLYKCITPAKNEEGEPENPQNRQFWSISEIRKLLKKLLKIDPETSDNPEYVWAIKYKTFNNLLDLLPRSDWRLLAFDWILLTCDILTIGLVRDYRNMEYEEWVRAQAQDLKSFLADPEKSKKIKEKAGKSGTIFFLFYMFKDFKANLLNIGLRGVAQKVVEDIPGTGL